MRSFLSVLIAWLLLFEAAARLGGLRGISWGFPGLDPLLPLAALPGLRRAGRSRLLLAASGLLALPPALLLQLALSTARNWRLNPLERLRPGCYADRLIERLDLPGPAGSIPALLVTPAGGTQRVVCVVHGSGCDKTFYAWRLVDCLIGEQLAVLLIDLDGHGESPRPQAFPTIVDSLAGAVTWSHARFARVGVLAMSLGGAVAARAVAEGLAVDALVLEAIPPRLRLDLAAYRRVQRQEALRLLNPALLHLFNDGNLYHVVQAWRTSGIRATIGTWDLFDALDLPTSLQTIGARPADQQPPTMLIYGDNDAIVPPAQMEEVRNLATPWAAFVILPGASHISLPIDLRTIRLAVGWFVQRL